MVHWALLSKEQFYYSLIPLLEPLCSATSHANMCQIIQLRHLT